ncbi:MAG TPA: amino acid ABC transporter permease [Anaerolineaceae bacterium]|nr:amino acid ABC transporter permease [Anaerolineaceae bacterium]
MDADAPQSAPPGKILANVPGAELASKMDRWWWMVFAVVALIIILIVTSPDPYQNMFAFFVSGIGVTLVVTILAFVLTLVLALFGALGRLSKNWLVHGIATIYVEIIRGIPLLVQLFFWYFAFPQVVQELGATLHIPAMETYQANPMLWAVAGLTICYAAYMSEIYRAGIQSISKGQMEAARSLGMTYVQAMRYVILPQAARVILPPVGNEFISLLKDSSLVSQVAIEDLTRLGREYAGAHYIAIPTWLMVALIYLVMTLLSARVVSWIERKTRVER